MEQLELASVALTAAPLLWMYIVNYRTRWSSSAPSTPWAGIDSAHMGHGESSGQGDLAAHENNRMCCRSRPNSGQHRAKLGPNSAQVGRFGPMPAQSWPSSCQIWPLPAEHLDHVRSNSALDWSGLGGCGPTSTRVGPSSASLGQTRTHLANFWRVRQTARDPLRCRRSGLGFDGRRQDSS